MTEPRPIDVTRKDGALVPKQRWLFDRMFAEGQDYTIEIHEPRSTKSHDHYFASVREVWKNLPEQMSKRFVDAEHLRKWSLIKTGWAIERSIVCESQDMANQVAALAGRLDESAVIIVQGSVVTIATARSQKTTGPDAMNKDEFQRSKSEVLDYIASLIGVDVATLSAQVPNSSGDASSKAHANAETDTPAAACGPQLASAAGVPPIEEASLLSPDWRDTYITTMTTPTTRAQSILSRHQTAIQMLGGDPNAQELAWMRMVAKLVSRRDENRLRQGEVFTDEIELLRTGPLPAAKVAA